MYICKFVLFINENSHIFRNYFVRIHERLLNWWALEQMNTVVYVFIARAFMPLHIWTRCRPTLLHRIEVQVNSDGKGNSCFYSQRCKKYGFRVSINKNHKFKIRSEMFILCTPSCFPLYINTSLLVVYIIPVNSLKIKIAFILLFLPCINIFAYLLAFP